MEPFHLGYLAATDGILREMQETYGFKEFCMDCLRRHRGGDWGDLPKDDLLANDQAVQNGGRILSAYDIPKDYCLGYVSKIWIITEADRSYTMLLFPYEY